MSTQPLYFLAQTPNSQEKEMHNKLCREGMSLAQTLNIHPCQYKAPTHLREDFIMPKYVARLSLHKEKIHLITKVLLANLMYSASEKNGYMRVLTSVRKLAQHLNLSITQVYYQLTLLQGLAVDEIAVDEIAVDEIAEEKEPMIVCMPYDIPIPKKDQIKCIRRQKTEQNKTSTNTKQNYISSLKESEQKRAAIRAMNFSAWERPIEIIILAHAYFKYNKGKKGDFFFSVNTTWEADKLSLVERYYLFYIQTNIYLNKLKEGKVYSTLYLATYAECFGVGINYSRRILQSLAAQGYIKLQIENQKTCVELLPKGVRRIDWFEKQLALTKN